MSVMCVFRKGEVRDRFEEGSGMDSVMVRDRLVRDVFI